MIAIRISDIQIYSPERNQNLSRHPELVATTAPATQARSREDERMVPVERSNTILYCERWAETVEFYRSGLGLAVTHENDWFVEFAVHPGSFLSVADAARSSIEAGRGAGLTLSWQVADIDAAKASLTEAGIDVGEPTVRFGARVVDVFDPVGNRIELWSGSLTGG
jgi:predicted enzyme related to lactoylglutathione lyase